MDDEEKEKALQLLKMYSDVRKPSKAGIKLYYAYFIFLDKKNLIDNPENDHILKTMREVFEQQFDIKL